MRRRKETIPQKFKCAKCGHEWTPRDESKLPETCPNSKCRSVKWNRESTVSGRLPGLSQQEKDNADRKFVKALKGDPEMKEKLAGELDARVLPGDVKPESLRMRVRANGKYEPQVLWDAEKRLIGDYKAGMGESPAWKEDFTEWFMEAFNLYQDMPWSTHEKFVERGYPRRGHIQDSIREGFGIGLEGLVDTICDEVTEECRHWNPLDPKRSRDAPMAVMTQKTSRSNLT